MVYKKLDQNVNHWRLASSSEPYSVAAGSNLSFPRPLQHMSQFQKNEYHRDPSSLLEGVHNRPYQRHVDNMATNIPITGPSQNITAVPNGNYSSQLINRTPVPPPRINQNLNPTDANPYGYGTSNYGNYGYGVSNYTVPPQRQLYNSYSYSQYSPYSSYGRPYVPPYNSVRNESSFLQEAHENTRDAFAGIESIVTAFGSINMMIESTYYALQSSFNAVLSVIDNFSRLKNHFSQVLSAFTIIRTLQWMLRKLLYLAGIQRQDPTTEAAWQIATKAVESGPENKSSRSSWPIVAFLLAVYAGPFLIWKFLSSLLKKHRENNDWTNPTGSHFYAHAIHSYKAQKSDELSVNVGDYLLLAPKETQTDKSWPLAYNGKSTGVVPVNYLRIGFNNGHNINPSVISQPGADNNNPSFVSDSSPLIHHIPKVSGETGHLSPTEEATHTSNELSTNYPSENQPQISQTNSVSEFQEPLASVTDNLEEEYFKSVK